MPVTTVGEAPDSVPDCAFCEISWSSTPGSPHGGEERLVGRTRRKA